MCLLLAIVGSMPDQIAANAKRLVIVVTISIDRWVDQMAIEIDAAQLIIIACDAAMVSSKNLSRSQ